MKASTVSQGTVAVSAKSIHAKGRSSSDSDTCSRMIVCLEQLKSKVNIQPKTSCDTLLCLGSLTYQIHTPSLFPCKDQSRDHVETSSASGSPP